MTIPYTEAISRLERDRDILYHNASLPGCEDSDRQLKAAEEVEEAIWCLKNVATLEAGGFTATIEPHPMRGEFGTVQLLDGDERPAGRVLDRNGKPIG